MVESRKAYKMHPMEGGNLPPEYKQTEGATFCENIECPYKQQGIEMTYTESESGIIHYCKAGGIVPENIRPTSKEFREVENSEHALDL